MSGLVKAKKYDWKDSNLALFGSDTEKSVKLESAQSEPAWQGSGQEVGLKIWRIVKFEVEEWPEEDFGQFYGGDSYIILNTYHPSEDSEELEYDVHFWIGEHSTQDEYGTAAYKTVELDTFLNDKAIQHREVMRHESDLFKSYFKKGITILKGGAASGFRHVAPEEYAPRLLQFCKQADTRKVVVKEVPLARSRVNSGDVYILDLGLELYQWNGKECSKDERFNAAQYLMNLKSERGNADSEVLEEEGLSETHKFYESLTGEDEDDEDVPDEAGTMELYKVSDESGSTESTKVKEGDVSIEDFDSGDVFMLDTGAGFYVWIGSGASAAEKRNGLAYANKQLKDSSHPYQPIVCIKEGQRNVGFSQAVGVAA